MDIMVVGMDIDTATNVALGTVVSRRLSEAGIPQREAADRAGIPMSTLRRRLIGSDAFDISELARLGRLFDAAPSALIIAAELEAAR
jgi:predicted transcriptional regulator